MTFDWSWLVLSNDKLWHAQTMQWMLVEGAEVMAGATAIIMPKLLDAGKTAVSRDFVGSLKPGVGLDQFFSAMTSYTRVAEHRDSDGKPERFLYISELAAMQMYTTGGTAAARTSMPVVPVCGANWSFTILGSPEAVDHFEEIFNCHFDLRARRSRALGEFYMLVKRNGKYRFVRVGTGASVFRPENYLEPAASSFAPMVSWLSDPKPFGRLVLMTGPTGTGKTFFIRGLMARSDVRWVFVPPGLLGNLASPEVVEPLAEFAAEDDDAVGGAPARPIVLIIEDADSLLLSRSRTKSAQAERLADLSTLLNMGDGMIGSSLNVRIIATCNGSVGKMDSAVLRKGRMFRQIDFPKLTASHASKLIQAATGDGTLCAKRAMTLTDVYGMIRDAEATAPAGE